MHQSKLKYIFNSSKLYYKTWEYNSNSCNGRKLQEKL